MTSGHRHTTAALSKTKSVRTIPTAREISSSVELKTAWREQATAVTIVENTDATVTCLKNLTLMGVPKIPRIVALKTIPVPRGKEVRASLQWYSLCDVDLTNMCQKTATVTGVLFPYDSAIQFEFLLGAVLLILFCCCQVIANKGSSVGRIIASRCSVGACRHTTA